MEPVEVDFFDPDFIKDPYPHYDRLRRNSPIFYSKQWGMWFFTRYQDVFRLLRDRRVGRSILHVATRQELGWPPEPPHHVSFNRFHRHALMELEPPDHTRLRGLVHKAFTARQVESLRGTIRRLSEQLLNGIASSPFDLMASFATPLPVAVIARLLGVPDADCGLLLPWSHRIVAFYELNRTQETVIDAGRAVEEFSDYLRELVEARRRAPRDDLITHLAQVEEEGQRLSEAELIATCILLFNAGHEATVNAIGNGALALLRHPDQLEKLRQNPNLIQSAIEEILRYDTPLQLFRRWVLEDFTYEGVSLKKGTEVALLFGSTNRDPARFPTPHRFEVARADNVHLSFGQGIHYCLGAPLARLELAIALPLLLERFPNLRLAKQTLEHHSSFIFHGLKALWLEGEGLSLPSS